MRKQHVHFYVTYTAIKAKFLPGLWNRFSAFARAKSIQAGVG